MMKSTNLLLVASLRRSVAKQSSSRVNHVEHNSLGMAGAHRATNALNKNKLLADYPLDFLKITKASTWPGMLT